MSLTDRELRWLRHIAIHGPQSSEFLLELVADTHRCRDTGLRTLQKLREREYLRLPPQQQQIAKADFHPYVYDLTRKAELYLQGLGDPKTTRPRGHWWHAFLTASITSVIAIEAARRGYRYIPAHEILSRSGATLAIPAGSQKLIPDQFFALDYGGTFRSFVLEVDRGTEPVSSLTGRKSVRRMIEQYEQLAAADRIRNHYRLNSPLLLLFVCTNPARMASLSKLVSKHAPTLRPLALFKTLPSVFPRYDAWQTLATEPWQRVSHTPQLIIEA